MKLLVGFFALLMFAACGSDAAPETPTDSVPAVPAVIDSLDLYDTLTGKGWTVLLLPATEAEFRAVADRSAWGIPCGASATEQYWQCFENWMRTRLAADTAFIVRADSTTLRVAGTSGQPILLRDIPYAEGNEGTTVSYSYAGRLPSLPWLVLGRGYYEGFEAALLNMADGRETMLFYYPQLSPGKTWLLAGNYDLEAGYTTNGLQLFRFENGALVKVVQKEYTRWGPTELKWESDTAAVMRQTIPDYSHETGSRHQFARLVIRKTN